MDVDTTYGPARVHVEEPEGADAAALLVLGHGAGGGVEAPDLVAVRDAALDRSIAVARVEQPYRVAGRRVPAPAKRLDEAWRTVIDALRSSPPASSRPGLPLIAGGRSSGARVACRTAVEVGATGVVALAFPLHPPGRPERSRAGELSDVGVPALAVGGDRDQFGTPEPSEGVMVSVAQGERHALSRDPKQVAVVVCDWIEALLD